MNNPLDILKLLNNKTSPKDLAINMMEQNANPLVKSLIEKAKNGKTDEVELFARNLCKEKGLDFDKEIQNFINNFK